MAKRSGRRWDVIDYEQRIWTLPAGRMKVGEAHRVPLSRNALSVLKKLDAVRTGEYVFAGQGQVSRSAHGDGMVLRRMKLKASPFTDSAVPSAIHYVPAHLYWFSWCLLNELRNPCTVTSSAFMRRKIICMTVAAQRLARPLTWENVFAKPCRIELFENRECPAR